MVPQSRESVTFTLSEPPASTPMHGTSGTPIKAGVIRAMAAQLQAEQMASAALDDLITVLRRLRDTPPPRAKSV